MSELSPQARALLSQARSGDEPSNADRARVHAAVLAKVMAAGTTAGLAGTAQAAEAGLASNSALGLKAGTTAAGAAVKAPIALATKLSLGKALTALCLIGGGVGVGSGVMEHKAESETAKPKLARAAIGASSSLEAPLRGAFARKLSVAGFTLSPRARETGPTLEAKAVPNEAAPSIAASPSLSARRGASAPRRGLRTKANDAKKFARASQSPESPRAESAAPLQVDEVSPTEAPRERTAKAPNQASPDPEIVQDASRKAAPDKLAHLREERRLINLARRSLRTRDALAALESLQEHRRQFPRGVLAQERAALTVLALCERGRRDRAKRIAMKFLRRFPRSPMRGRIEASRCAPESE